MIFEVLLFIGISLCVYTLHKWSSKNNDYFERQGLKYRKPLPLIGISTLFSLRKNITEVILENYNKFPGEKLVGLFDFYTPLFYIRSLKLVKQLAVKDFAYFQDHRTFPQINRDDLFSTSLFVMKGEEWRDMRSSLTPLFTGSKMRLMLELIVNYSNQVVDFLKEDYEKNGLKPYRMKDFFSRCTNDIIASCAFGVECNSLKNPKNEVFMIGQELLKFQKPFQTLKFFVMLLMPKLAKLLNIQFIDNKVNKRFEDFIKHTMDVRTNEGIIRPDMINLLRKLKEGQNLTDKDDTETENERKLINGSIKQTWSEHELIAQCFLFFLGGFDTSSGALHFCSYELATNPNVQEKLIQEVDETYENLDGKPITYEVIKKMKYMEMFVSEVLRRWPPFVAIDRQCVKNYKYEDEDGFKVSVNEGDVIWFPIYALHMDPEYFPEPEKFDPERFNDENRPNINMDAYLPFGMGPRNCIGFRFALMEIKTLLFYILLHFNFKVCEDTPIPLKLKKAVFGLVPDKEIKLYIEPRSKI